MNASNEHDRKVIRDILSSNRATINRHEEKQTAEVDERLARLRSPVEKQVAAMRLDLPQATEEAQRAVEYAAELRELIPTSRLWQNRMAHSHVVRFVEELERMGATVKTAGGSTGIRQPLSPVHSAGSRLGRMAKVHT